MIKDHDLSKKLIQNVHQADKLFNDSLIWVRDNCIQQEFEDYRRSIAHVLAITFDKIIVPLSETHPDLDPLKKLEEKEKISKNREDNIPSYDKDALPMLERLYHIEKEDGSKSGMTINIRKPAKSTDGDDWYCTWKITSEFGCLRKKSFGIDAVESFSKAIPAIQEKVENIVGKSKITWLGGEGLCLPGNNA